MARRTVASSLVIVCFALVAGCVDVPEGIRADFAGPGANDRSNFRQGSHGSAKPVVEVADTPASAPAAPSAPASAPAAAPPAAPAVKAAEADAGPAAATTETTSATTNAPAVGASQ